MVGPYDSLLDPTNTQRLHRHILERYQLERDHISDDCQH
jgi:hypothetical protein